MAVKRSLDVDFVVAAVVTRKILLNIFPSLLLLAYSKLQRLSSGRCDRLALSACGVFWLDHEAGAGFLDDLPGLTVHAQNHRPGAGHEFQHLCGNHGLEDISFLEKDEAGVGSGDEGRNFFAGLLVEKLDVSQARDCASALILSFSAPSPISRNSTSGFCCLKLRGRIEQSLEAVGHSHRADVADKNLIRAESWRRYRSADIGGSGREQIRLDSVFDDRNFFRGHPPALRSNDP